MDAQAVLDAVALGEDSRRQLKRNVTSQDSLAQELAAFSNGDGGSILIGIADDGTVVGLSADDVRRLNEMISNTASESIRPAIVPRTEVVSVEGRNVMVLTVQRGIAKPYMTRDGAIRVKSGADKRKATSREELQRLFQAAGLVHADEVPANGLTTANLNLDYFGRFYEETYGEPLADARLALPQLLDNMNLARDAQLNVAGALLFASKPQYRLPAFIVKAVAYPGTDVDLAVYLDTADIVGRLSDVFDATVTFVLRNLRHVQGDRSVNSLGVPEIPRIAIEEIVANALVHRDYFITAPVRVFVFADRVEVISPGHLPNNLTVANVRAGVSNLRNPVLASFATKVLPYRGLGTGIRRALKAHPRTELADDRDGNQFIVTMARSPEARA